MKYGQIKQSIITYLTENYSNGNFKAAFKSAVVPLLETKKFKEIYHLYSQIEENRFDDQKTAEVFLNESIQRIKNLSKGLRLNIPEEITSMKGEPNFVYENIDTLVYSKDVMKRVESMKNLWNHLTRSQNDTSTFAPVNEAILINLLTKEYNDQFGNISESDKEAISKYINLNESEIREKINENKTTLLSKLESMRSGMLTEEKEKIGQTISEIKSMSYNRYNLYRLDNLLADLGV